MPSPSSSLATLRPDLQGGLLQFDLAMDRAGFIGQRVFPILECAVAAGTFGKITLESLLKARETRRAARGGYNRGDWDFTTGSFATEEHGWEEPVDDNEARMYADYFDLEQVCAERAFDTVLRAQEQRVADAVFDTSVWTGSDLAQAVAYAWVAANAATATPIADVNAAAEHVWANCGMWPNALILNRLNFRRLKLLDDIKEAIASSGAGGSIAAGAIGIAQLANVFDLEYILVGGSAQDAAVEGQDRSLAHIWSSSYAMVARICTGNDIREPGLGRTFHWGADGSDIGGSVETYRDETIRGDVVRVRHQTEEKVLYAECGCLLTGVAG